MLNKHLSISNGNDLLHYLPDICNQGMRNYAQGILSQYPSDIDYYNLSDQHQMDILNCIDFSHVCRTYFIEESAITEFRCHMDWANLTRTQTLPEHIRKEHIYRVDPNMQIIYQNLSDMEICDIFQIRDMAAKYGYRATQLIEDHPDWKEKFYSSEWERYYGEDLCVYALMEELVNQTNLSDEEIENFINNLSGNRYDNRCAIAEFIQANLRTFPPKILINTLDDLNAFIDNEVEKLSQEIGFNLEECKNKPTDEWSREEYKLVDITYKPNNWLENLNALHDIINFKSIEFSYDFIKNNPDYFKDFYLFHNRVPESLLPPEDSWFWEGNKVYKFTGERVSEMDEWTSYVHQYISDEHILNTYKQYFDAAIENSDDFYRNDVTAGRLLMYTHISPAVEAELIQYALVYEQSDIIDILQNRGLASETRIKEVSKEFENDLTLANNHSKNPLENTNEKAELNNLEDILHHYNDICKPQYAEWGTNMLSKYGKDVKIKDLSFDDFTCLLNSLDIYKIVTNYNTPQELLNSLGEIEAPQVAASIRFDTLEDVRTYIAEYLIDNANLLQGWNCSIDDIDDNVSSKCLFELLKLMPNGVGYSLSPDLANEILLEQELNVKNVALMLRPSPYKYLIDDIINYQDTKDDDEVAGYYSPEYCFEADVRYKTEKRISALLSKCNLSAEALVDVYNTMDKYCHNDKDFITSLEDTIEYVEQHGHSLSEFTPERYCQMKGQEITPETISEANQKYQQATEYVNSILHPELVQNRKESIKDIIINDIDNRTARDDEAR